jgi:flagellar protein FlgJ
VGNPSVAPTYYADFSGLEGLKRNVKADDPQAIRAAAQQFESLFTNMMLKAMRDAKLGNGLGDSQQSDLYQDMYDQQLALKISQGKGIGLADMLVQQLMRNGAARAATGAGGASAAAAPGTANGASATGGAPPTAANRMEFIRMLEPYAQKASGALGVSSDTLIAQAALETGWGQHVPSSAAAGSSFNLFGVKAGSGWSGGAVTASTTEYAGAGAASVQQPFRRYSSVEQGVNDYVTLLQRSGRYDGALGSGEDVTAFGTALARGGYATDPGYVAKLEATVASVKSLRAGTTALKNGGLQPTTGGGETS